MTKPLLGFLGLGRMGLPMCHLIAKQCNIVTYDINAGTRQKAKEKRLCVADSIRKLIKNISRSNQPRIIWLMVPSATVSNLIDQLIPELQKDDIIIDGGNSSFSHSRQQQGKLDKSGIQFVSIGCSGGLTGAKNGPPMTVSCDQSTLKRIEPFLLALGNNYAHYEGAAFGHLAKGIHNAIEYGMMESIAEGIALYFEHGFTQKEILDTFKVWSRGSIIESALLECAIKCLEDYDFSKNKSIKQSETIELLEEICQVNNSTPVISAAINVRKDSSSVSAKTETTLALLRKTFGGHAISNK
tara:strand:+ start:401 stop:1297 length:897 start_codon:yes stop_codon:yes gene_type:complete